MWLRQERICLQCWRPRFNPWVKKIPQRREWLPTPVFLPGECNGQRSLTDYSPWGHKGSDTTEQLTHIHTHTLTFTFTICKSVFLYILGKRRITLDHKKLLSMEKALT